MRTTELHNEPGRKRFSDKKDNKAEPEAFTASSRCASGRGGLGQASQNTYITKLNEKDGKIQNENSTKTIFVKDTNQNGKEAADQRTLI